MENSIITNQATMVTAQFLNFKLKYIKYYLYMCYVPFYTATQVSAIDLSTVFVAL